MKKGFIFSVDAAMALLIVMAMAAFMVVYFQASDATEEVYMTGEKIAADAAVVGFYLNKDAAAMGLETGIPGNASFGSCSVVYEYEPLANGTRDGPTAKQYCRVVT